MFMSGTKIEIIIDDNDVWRCIVISELRKRGYK